MSNSDQELRNEEQQALARRAVRKSAKKKITTAREVFLTERLAAVDHGDLQLSMEQFKKTQSRVLEEGVEGEVQPAGVSITPQAFADNNQNRWVPIGPSVVRRGQAEGGPLVSGRVRDLAVSSDGTRVYAATAKGGVWFSEDAGSTWEPLGGWANEPRLSGGNVSSFACGCLLVAFGASVEDDFVMVGTGEIGATQSGVNSSGMRGMGVLVATAPSDQSLNSIPWEFVTGNTVFEGVSIARMVRVPGSNAGEDGDQVIAATSAGLYIGTRFTIGGFGAFTWTPLRSPGAPPPPTGSPIALDPTDLVFVANRLFISFRSSGVALCDNITNPIDPADPLNTGPTFRWVAMGLSIAGSTLLGRMSLALNDDNNTLYILGEVDTTPAGPNLTEVAQVWQIASPSGAAAAVPLAGVPPSAQLWGTGAGSQRDYDQAISVTTYGPVAARIDRVYFGGSLVGGPANGGTVNGLDDWNASLWAFDVAMLSLNAAMGVSDQPVGHGANTPGLIGNGIHPDVHVIRAATNSNGSRQIWIGCDGGVFASLTDGQTNTFRNRNVGLASIEVGFVDSHPTSSHFAILGCQDNGRQVRVGETVWEIAGNLTGDGGGVLFHPVHSNIIVGQWTAGTWEAAPTSRFRAPLNVPVNNPDLENSDSAFYSGISAITRLPPNNNRARIALGTNRVWITDNLGSANRNTWRVLPITNGPPSVSARDQRPGLRGPNAANIQIGVPLPLPLPRPNPPAPQWLGQMGPVVTVKWENPTTLLALYTWGVVRYTEDPVTPNNWTSISLLTPASVPIVLQPPAVPPQSVIPRSLFFTDIEPVPGTGGDFYLSCSGATNQWTSAMPATPTSAAVAAIPPTPDIDSCYYFDSNAGGANVGGFLRTGLGATLPIVAPRVTSPIDPVYSVVIDPTNPNKVYAGTATGVWTSTKNPANNVHGNWIPFDNGLPQAVVQDLTVWQDPSGDVSSPRLLRAAIQSRGVWEVNLASPEPQRTYLRVHERDDRRQFPTPLKNPRHRPTAPDISAFRSPDITIRPQAPVVSRPTFRGTNIRNGALKYQLWTFQTAFRWLSPSVIPNGEWTDQFGDLVERYRLANTPSTPPLPTLTQRNTSARRRIVDRELWNHVMAAAMDESGSPGVYRAPWRNVLPSSPPDPADPAQPATEIDIIESVVPRRDTNNVWQVYRERSTVDVLLHHRDTRPVPKNQSVVILLWRTSRSTSTLRNTNCSAIPAYARSLFNGPALPTPPGWNVQNAADGTPLHRLSVALSARMPRAVPIDLDLSGATIAREGDRVMLLAIAGSSVDQFSAVPTGPIDNVENFIRNWPHAATRLISCWTRPGTPIH